MAKCGTAMHYSGLLRKKHFKVRFVYIVRTAEFCCADTCSKLEAQITSRTCRLRDSIISDHPQRQRYHIGSCTQLHSTDRYHTRARRAYMPPNHYDIVNNPSSVVDTVYSARTGRRTSRCYDDSAAAAAAAAAAVKPVTLRTISFCLGSNRGWQK